MKRLNKISILFASFIVIALAVIFLDLASAEFTSYTSTSASFVNPQLYQPGFQTYYSASDINTYWPVLGNSTECSSRQDVILKISSVGCQPAVVRSDLLAEQNVPVFCQIDALQVNPLINIKEISNIRFTGNYPPGVIGTGFHPARAAINTRDQLLGDALINNVGYAVIILKQTPKESDLPGAINVNLTGQIDFNSGNSFGIGRTEFTLKQVSDADWQQERDKQTFWNGRYSVRLEGVDANSALVSIYFGDQKISTVRADKNVLSREIYVPGYYCQAGIQVYYEGQEAAQNGARLEVTSTQGVDTFDVYQGSTFLNNKCTVTRVSPNTDGQTGNVTVSCNLRPIQLSLQPKFAEFGGKSPQQDTQNKIIFIDFGAGSGSYGLGLLDTTNTLMTRISGTTGKWAPVDSKQLTEGSSLQKLRDSLIAYKSLTQKATGKLSPLTGSAQGQAALSEQLYGAETMQKFNDAIAAYLGLFNDYPAERAQIGDVKTETIFAEQGLGRAIDLADSFKRYDTESSLINQYLQKYPDSLNADKYRKQLSNLYIQDSSLSGENVQIDNQFVNIRLVKFTVPDKRSVADMTFFNPLSVSGVSQNSVKISLNDAQEISLQGDRTNALPRARVSVDRLDSENAQLTVECFNKTGYFGSKPVIGVSTSAVKICADLSVKLNSVDLENVARVRLEPISTGGTIQTNLTVNIGIEKRLIQLSPEMTKEKISELNNSIQKWESISSNLKDVVSGLQATCFVTAGVLTIKNFFSGLTGESAARETAMKEAGGWDDKCKSEVALYHYSSLDACFNAKADEINKDVKGYQTAITQANSVLKQIENDAKTSSSILGDKTFDEDKAKTALAERIKSDFPTKEISLNGNNVTIADWVNDPTNLQQIYYTDLRDIYMRLKAEDAGLSDTGASGADKFLNSTVIRINGLAKSYSDMQKQVALTKQGRLPTVLVTANPAQQSTIITPITSIESSPLKSSFTVSGITHLVKVDAIGGAQTGNTPNTEALISQGAASSLSLSNPTSTTPNAGTDFATQTAPTTAFNLDFASTAPNAGTNLENLQIPATSLSLRSITGGFYVLGLRKDQASGKYVPVEAIKVDDNEQITTPKVDLTSSDLDRFLTTYRIGTITSADNVNYMHKMLDPKVQYFETEPYKGMPAVVPFDTQNGWYVATKQTLSALGGIGTFDASGRVATIWLCNVGDNGRIDFNNGISDDICQQFNMNTGQSFANFPGLSETESKSKVGCATEAISQASQQYAAQVRQITIRTCGRKEVLAVGNPAVNVPSTKCQDFMSPKECQLMFNVCDPVICPSSRCNFGGLYPVSNVQQTGIVGSALLCLPNFKEGIYIPVCLSGIQAGIDAYVSMLKNHRDCLQQNLENGQLIGICDEIYSVYACEFFWSEIAPAVNILVPKLGQALLGQGTRGGGEYMTFSAAWQNAQNSMKYFTDTYAVNTFKAFQARNIGEAGTSVCKAFISAKAPTSFQSLIEPASPPQFYASFSSTPYTTATVPATATYKVFYHIFGGQDSGVNYQVYLKTPPQSYYYSADRVIVATGFIAKGQYASETKDFTAPDGYKELCVVINAEEKCGFKEVTTDFSANYLQDLYAQQQITQTGITKEADCVSGTPSILPLASSLNPQEGVAATISPQIYTNGIIRICSTGNPGSSTDPARFVPVGYCGNQNVVCWLDKNSINNAITKENLGVRNQTLEQLNASSSDYFNRLITQGEMLGQQDAAAEIKNLEAGLNNLVISIDTLDLTDANTIINRITFLMDKIYYNHQKANIELIKAEIIEKIAVAYKQKYGTSGAPASNAGAAGTAAGGQTTISSLNLIDTYDSSAVGTVFSVVGTSDPIFGSIYVQGREVHSVFSSGDILIGSVSSDNKISLLTDNNIISAIGSDHYASLNGARIIGSQIILIQSYSTSTSNVQSSVAVQNTLSCNYACIHSNDKSLIGNEVMRDFSTGNDVGYLQCILTALGYSTGTGDCIYGDLTKTAVINFQRGSKLSSPDGIVGPATILALRNSFLQHWQNSKDYFLDPGTSVQSMTTQTTTTQTCTVSFLQNGAEVTGTMKYLSADQLIVKLDGCNNIARATISTINQGVYPISFSNNLYIISFVAKDQVPPTSFLYGQDDTFTVDIYDINGNKIGSSSINLS